MGLFSLLFGKRIPSVHSDNMTIDMNQLGVYVDNTHFSLPCRLSDLEAVLGGARKAVKKAGVNYYWDNTGIMCYTRDGKTVHTMAVKVNDSALSTDDDKKMTLFKGRLTVNGMDWESVMRRGEKTEFFFRITLVNLSAVSEYGDFMDDTVISGVEITCESTIGGNF